ncbi:unnamed protein product [Allacma fusca]|uniref:Transmembrane protein n=1 Tax=Allacma fusca TaxID=39272 RepID=A0A8J2NXK7_9HEXA|nr:unnamed protein product [Allacma fusca]
MSGETSFIFSLVKFGTLQELLRTFIKSAKPSICTSVSFSLLSSQQFQTIFSLTPQNKKAFVILAVAFACLALATASSQRGQESAQQHQQQQQQQQNPQDLLKSGGSRVTRRDYHYDNSWWAIGLILVPLLILLCFPLFSTPYGMHHGGGHHGGHHGGWGWGRSAKDTEQIQERVLKSVEG